MKKLILFLAAITAIGCATANSPTPEDPYKHLTVEKVSKFCKPINVWNIGVLGNPAMVATFEHCLEVDNLLLVVTSYIDDNQELGPAIITVVRLSYIGYLNETSSENIYSTRRLKEAYRSNGEKENARDHVTFYSIESTKKTK
jgi:hypothetical protein